MRVAGMAVPCVGLALRARPGSSVDVRLVLRVDKQALVAPESAIQEGQNGPYAFVVDQENKARFRLVKVVRRTRDLVLVGSGLKAGDRVVTDGQVRLREGAQVTLLQPENRSADAGVAGGDASDGAP